MRRTSFDSPVATKSYLLCQHCEDYNAYYSDKKKYIRVPLPKINGKYTCPKCKRTVEQWQSEYIDKYYSMTGKY